MGRSVSRGLKGLLVVVTFVGCSSADSGYTVAARGESAAPIDPRILPYYREFARAAGQSIPAIRVSVGNLEAGVAGKCYRPGEKAVTNQVGEIFFGEATDPQMRVVISAKYYEKHERNPFAIHQVVFHELGHCLLGRGHDDRWAKHRGEEVPRSIMYSRSFGDQRWYEGLLPYYEKEMFGLTADKTEIQLVEGDEMPPHEHVGGWTCGTGRKEPTDLASTL